MNKSDIESQFADSRMKEIAMFTKEKYCEGILEDHLKRFIKTNKIGGEFFDCDVSKDLFFDKIFPKKNPTRFVNSDKFKGRINEDGMIDIFIAVTKNGDGEYEKLFWYTLLNIPRNVKPSNLCVKGTIKFKDGENDDLFDRFQECLVTKIDETSQVTDSDEESSHGPKVYESFIKGKVKKNTKKIKNKSQSDNEFDEVPDSASVSDNEIHVDEEPQSDAESVKSSKSVKSNKSIKSNELITGGALKDDVSDESSSEEEEVEEVEQFNPFKNKTTFQNYLKDNDLRSKKVFKATIEKLDKDIKVKFDGIKKTQEFVDQFFKLKIVPKKE